jgi:hypothetical protein
MHVDARRAATLAGVGLALLLGVAAMRVAAAWTAEAAPLPGNPASVAELQSALARETARSAELRAQLDELTTGSGSLADALAAAEDRVRADAAEADALRTQLATAQQRLAELDASIASARAGRVGGSDGAATAAGSRNDEYDDDDHEGSEHEDGHEDDDD